MAAKSGNRTPDELKREIEAVQADLDARGEEALRDLLPLTVNDCAVIGLIVQTFAYVDLNARRALEIIDHFEGKEPTPLNKTLRDTEVLPKLLERSAVLPLSDDERSALKTAITMFEKFAFLRHMFAHWAARRHPTKDVLVTFTKNAKEGARRSGLDPEQFEANNAVVPMEGVRMNIKPLENNADFLAARVSDWWQRFMPSQGS